MSAESLSHIDQAGAARMVDVGGKPDLLRTAVATGTIHINQKTMTAILEGAVKKGDVLAVARLAGIMAAKKTADLIPLCHPLALSHAAVDLVPKPDQGRIEITATVKTTGPTGVEMEALTAVSVAALTIYDMAKALDKAMRITDITLLKKDKIKP